MLIFATATTNLKSYTRMKQVLLMAVLAAGLLLTGCSKDESNGMEFTISESSVSLLAHDDYKITPSGAFTARSTNEDVATVSSDGTIHAVSAGNADIIFTSTEDGQEQTCKVSVDWRYKYFEEPIIAFGATKEEIKARETHEVTLEDEDAGYLLYEYPKSTEILIAVRYYFGDDVKTNRITIVPYGQRYADYYDKIVQQLTERYGEPSIISTNTKVFTPRNRDFIVNYYHRIGGFAEYLPNGNN